MARKATYEQALINLLGTSEVPESPDQYPDTITLPDVVHANTALAVERQLATGLEHSNRFNLRGNRWRGGIMLKGSTYLRSNGRRVWQTSELEQWRTYFFGPSHISMHTHPVINYKEGPTSMLPTPRDVAVYLQAEDLSQVNASERGRFICIDNNVYRPKASSAEREKIRLASSFTRYRLDEMYKQLGNLEFQHTNPTERILDTTVEALAGRYVCYMANGSTPTLERVRV